MKALYRTLKMPRWRAQAIVEFAIVLPILMMLLVGILEVGRLIFMYAAVTNASREAARYGSAVGLDEDPDDGINYQKYSYCKGIRSMARRSAYFLNLPASAINIAYDRNLTTTIVSNCDAASGEDSDVESSVQAGDRVVVTITAKYTPLVKLIPIGEKDIISRSARTILGVYDLESGVGSVPVAGGGGGGGGGGGSTNTPTATSTATTTATATSTDIGPYTTPTFPTPTPTLEFGVTPTDTATPTETLTPTATFTPTPTSTPVPGCGQLSVSDLSISGSSMRVTIRNPHEAITVSSITVTWNHDTGGGGKNPALTLQSILLELETWTVLADGPSVTFSPVPAMIIPGNDLSSTIAFTFNKGYQNIDGSEAVVINFSTAGCESIHRPQPTVTPTQAATQTPTPTETPTLVP